MSRVKVLVGKWVTYRETGDLSGNASSLCSSSSYLRECVDQNEQFDMILDITIEAPKYSGHPFLEYLRV